MRLIPVERSIPARYNANNKSIHQEGGGVGSSDDITAKPSTDRGDAHDCPVDGEPRPDWRWLSRNRRLCTAAGRQTPACAQSARHRDRSASRSVPAIRTTTRPTVVAYGEVVPAVRTQLVAQVGGKVTRIAPAFTEGGQFAPADVLLSIEDTDYRAAVEEESAGRGRQG